MSERDTLIKIYKKGNEVSQRIRGDIYNVEMLLEHMLDQAILGDIDIDTVYKLDEASETADHDPHIIMVKTAVGTRKRISGGFGDIMTMLTRAIAQVIVSNVNSDHYEVAAELAMYDINRAIDDYKDKQED